MRETVICLVTCLLSNVLSAQTAKTTGWVVQTSGDTLHGSILRTAFTDYSEHICLITGAGKRCFTPSDALSFYAKADGLFESHPVSWFQNDQAGRSKPYHQRVFVRKLVNGPLSLYELDRFSRFFYYISGGAGDTLTYLPHYFEQVDEQFHPTGYRTTTLEGMGYNVEKLPNGLVLLRTDRGYFRPNRSFQNVLRGAMQNCPQIHISPRLEYRADLLTTLVRNYNGCRGVKDNTILAHGQTRSVALMGGFWKEGTSISVLFDFGYKRNPKVHPQIFLQRYQFSTAPINVPAHFHTFALRVSYDVITLGPLGAQLIGGGEIALGAPKSLYGPSILRAHLGVGIDIRLLRALYWHTEATVPLFPQVRTGAQLRF